MVKGEIPDRIDHINGDRTDNRLENLRNVSHSINLKNTKAEGEKSMDVMEEGNLSQPMKSPIPPLAVIVISRRKIL